MKFLVDNISKSSGRLGHLLHQETGRSFKTPLLIQCTKGGSIPHLSHEVFDYITRDTQVLLLSLSTITHMAEALKVFNKGVSTFVGYANSPNILTIRDVCEITPSGFNEKDIVPLFTRRGKELLTPEEYMELVEAISPDIYIGLSDADTNEDSSKKRVQKSVDRTDEFFSFCYGKHRNSENLSKSSLFAPIVGGYNKFARTLSIKKAKEKIDVGGYALDGFHNNGITATKINQSLLVDVVSHCMNELDTDKPKLMLGAYNPLAVAELIRLGVDIFDTSYAYVAAVNFKALTFNFDLTKETQSKPFVDIVDQRLKEDFTPFLEGCHCIACRQHTKAYVHHLYNTRELLGPILLMMYSHNTHHYMEFFNAIKLAIASDSLGNLINVLRKQGTQEPVDYTIDELPKSSNQNDDKKAMFKQMATT